MPFRKPMVSDSFQQRACQPLRRRAGYKLSWFFKQPARCLAQRVAGTLAENRRYSDCDRRISAEPESAF
jgi:hypothetical protein